MRRLSLILSLAALVGCSDNPAEPTLGPTDADVTGTYNLATSNGNPLPLIARLNTEEQWNLIADRLVISSDKTWTETTSYQIRKFATETITAQQGQSSGTYSISNGKINFVMTVGGTTTFTGSVARDTLSLLYNGARFSYTR